MILRGSPPSDAPALSYLSRPTIDSGSAVGTLTLPAPQHPALISIGVVPQGQTTIQ